MEKWKSLVKAEFRIIGKKIDIEEITTLLGIKPTRAFNRNDKDAPLPISKKKGEWMLSTKYEISPDSCQQLKKIITQLLPKIEELKLIKKRWDCEFIFGFVIEIYGSQCPAISLDPEDIEFFYQLSAFYDVDLYYMGEYDEEARKWEHGE